MLSKRDDRILEFLLDHKAAPLDVLERLFFEKNPQTGKANRNPAAACARRLAELAVEGYVELESCRERGNEIRTRVARPTPRASKLFNRPPVKRVHGRSRDHHYASLRAVIRLQERLQARGYGVENLHLEHALRAQVQGGAIGRPGQTFASFPDAALTAVSADGERFEIAVEYVTSKYCDADIVSKARGFACGYQRIEWVADTHATAERITRLTGQPAQKRA